MTQRTGLGPIEVGALSALDELGAGPDAQYLKNVRTLRLVGARSGLGPRYAWDVLRDLARPWRAPVSLVEFHGNDLDMGAPPLLEASWTESRLSPVGAVALAAERGEGPALPIGIVNGDLYQGGERPPLSAEGVIEALLLLLGTTSVADERLLGALGPPVLSHGCEILGDIDALFAGHPTVLSLYPRVTVGTAGGRTILPLSHFPPELWAHRLRRAGRVNP